VPPAASGDFCADGGVTVVFFLNASLSCSWVSDWKLSIRPAFLSPAIRTKRPDPGGIAGLEVAACQWVCRQAWVAATQLVIANLYAEVSRGGMPRVASKPTGSRDLW
jgi:hypothetical protein